jgi:hypothetical protein
MYHDSGVYYFPFDRLIYKFLCRGSTNRRHQLDRHLRRPSPHQEDRQHPVQVQMLALELEVFEDMG